MQKMSSSLASWSSHLTNTLIWIYKKEMSYNFIIVDDIIQLHRIRYLWVRRFDWNRSCVRIVRLNLQRADQTRILTAKKLKIIIHFIDHEWLRIVNSYASDWGRGKDTETENFIVDNIIRNENYFFLNLRLEIVPCTEALTIFVAVTKI